MNENVEVNNEKLDQKDVSSKIYYSFKNKSFYDSEINNNIPSDAIEITKDKHNELVLALSNACIIFDDLSYSPPKPSLYHEFVNGEWVESADLKRKFLVPQSLSRFQAITVLKLTKATKDKNLYQATNDYINSLSDDSVENITAKTAWETAQEFRRDSALIKIAQTMFKLTDNQVDEMFINGAKITA